MISRASLRWIVPINSLEDKHKDNAENGRPRKCAAGGRVGSRTCVLSKSYVLTKS
jgi:hypothetical protein